MRTAALLSLALSLNLGAAAARGEDIQVVVCGRYHEPVTAYRAGGNIFINAKQAGEIYGGQVYWYPISGRVQLSFRGRVLQLLVGSREAVAGERTVPLGAPVMLRAAQAYVPLSFFLGADFAALSGMESQFDERTWLLTLDRHSNIGPVRWFSYQDYTRVVLELKRPLGHSAAARGVRGVELTVPFGVIEAPEQARVGDGLVEGYALRQEAKVARLSVQFSRPGLKWRARELSAPRRLALEIAAVDPEDVVPGSAAELEAGASRQAAAPEALPAVAPAASSAIGESPRAGGDASQRVAAPAAAQAAGPAKRRIVIDPGHGGKDAGATGRRGTLEKDINLAAAKELGKLLEEEKVFEVLLTRNYDTFVPLADRSRMADEAHADLFISLHCNAHKNAKENGFEVYFLSEQASDPEAERLAEFENSSLELEGKSPSDAQAGLILRAMSKTENINAAAELAALLTRALHRRVDLSPRGVKQASFYVLRGTDAPAVLVEMAFLTNRRDEAKLETRRYRRRIVDGLYAGLVDYAKRQGWLDQGPGRSVR